MNVTSTALNAAAPQSHIAHEITVSLSVRLAELATDAGPVEGRFITKIVKLASVSCSTSSISEPRYFL